MNEGKTIKIALFAADKVGLEIVRLFRDKGQKPKVLVLDPKDKGKCNAQILASTNAELVLYSDVLEEKKTQEDLRKRKLDLIILAWWPYILKEDIFHLSRLGALNFHPSYLPYNRGKNPNFWSIVEDTPFGVSLHFVDAGIDTGNIAFQKRLTKTWEDTGKSLHEVSRWEIVSLFKQHFDEILRGEIPRKKQNFSKGSFHKESELEEASQIELEKVYRARDLLNLLRARTYPPHPATWFIDGGQKYEVRIEIKRVTT